MIFFLFVWCVTMTFVQAHWVWINQNIFYKLADATILSAWMYLACIIWPLFKKEIKQKYEKACQRIN